MLRPLRISALVLFLALPAVAQQKAPHAASPRSDVAFTFDVERAQVDATAGNSFWLKGGSVNASFPLWRYLYLAGDVTGEQAGNIQNSVDLNKLSYTAGPRVRSYVGHLQSTTLFAQALFGGMHGFSGLYPGPGGTQYSASSWAMQAGGGVDLTLSHHLGLRLVEVDWVHSALPNNASNSQNDLKLGIGVSFH